MATPTNSKSTPVLRKHASNIIESRGGDQAEAKEPATPQWFQNEVVGSTVLLGSNHDFPVLARRSEDRDGFLRLGRDRFSVG